MPLLPEILLVEDSPDDRALFARAVLESRLPVQVTYATGAAEAVLRLNRLRQYAGMPLPSLVVLDLSLPGLHGATLLQVIRNAFGPRHLPIVVLTGSFSEEDRVTCERWGISGYYVKPNTHFGLVRVVATFGRYLGAELGGAAQAEGRT
jgi:CheY-like chemotaxis protein